MTNETKALAFCHWFQGYFELNDVVDGSTHISPEQAELIRKKLDGVVPSERSPALPLGRIDMNKIAGTPDAIVGKPADPLNPPPYSQFMGVAVPERKIGSSQCKHGVILYGNTCLTCAKEVAETKANPEDLIPLEG